VIKWIPVFSTFAASSSTSAGFATSPRFEAIQERAAPATATEPSRAYTGGWTKTKTNSSNVSFKNKIESKINYYCNKLKETVERLLNDFRLSILLFMHHFEKKNLTGN
jgi:hypothetical protein